jgi:serine protease Do
VVQLNETNRSAGRANAARRDASILQPLLVWLTGILVMAVMATAAATAHARSAPESFAGIAQEVVPAVVSISSTGAPQSEQFQFQFPPGSPFEEFFKEFFERNRPQEMPQRRPISLGSGFIVDKRGYVVTNNHVIADAEEIKVVMHDDTIFTAKVVGRDPDTDLAVLKIDPEDRTLPTVGFGDSDAAKVGDWVIAVGNPFGLGNTVTAGIVSARGRDINAGRYDDFIQTDAPINKGNSGGPLFDESGKVVGINTMIYSMSGGNVGIGFAVPAAVAEPVVRQLIEHGKVRRGWLGVRIQTVTDEIAESLGLDEASGALVASVADDSPAAEGGIKPRDVILRFAGHKVEDMRKLPRIVAETEIGKQVDVVVWRDRERKTLQVTVGELTQEKMAALSPQPQQQPGSTEMKIDALGVTVSSLTSELRERYSIGDDAKGVVVTDVDASGPAAEKGIRPGEIIVEVGQQTVSSPAEVAAKVDEASKAGRRSVLLLVEGQGGPRFVALRLGKG